MAKKLKRRGGTKTVDIVLEYIYSAVVDSLWRPIFPSLCLHFLFRSLLGFDMENNRCTIIRTGARSRAFDVALEWTWHSERERERGFFLKRY